MRSVRDPSWKGHPDPRDDEVRDEDGTTAAERRDLERQDGPNGGDGDDD